MSFWVFYLLVPLPLLVGGILWATDKHVNWIEYVSGAVLAFVMAGIMHLVAIHGVTDDIETWSGQIIQARHYAAWEEYYQEAIYRTESYECGTTKNPSTCYRQVFDHWEDRTRWHQDTYHSWSNINTSYGISLDTYLYLTRVFADNHAVRGDRTTGEHNSRMIGGDPNDYVTDNKTGWIQPITDLRHFENRIKAAPSVFSFVQPPPTVKTYPYPANNDPWHSDRLIGSAALLNWLPFDQMNARLGPSKKVNVIMIGAGNKDQFFSQWQEAAWLKGRKNDVSILWIGSNAHPTYCRVFSWGEGRALRNIEALILDKGVSDAILPDIERELKTNFIRADWSKFNYISIECPVRYLWWYLGFMITIQGSFWCYAHYNQFDKESPVRSLNRW